MTVMSGRLWAWLTLTQSPGHRTSDGLLYFGHRPIYKPQNTKLNYAHKQTNKIYKQQNTQKNKTNIDKQTNKQTKRRKSGPNSHTEIMRHYGGRWRQSNKVQESSRGGRWNSNQSSHSRMDCLAAELFLNSCFSDTAIVTLFRTAVERASCEVDKLLRTGGVPTSLTLLFWWSLAVSSVFGGRSAGT